MFIVVKVKFVFDIKKNVKNIVLNSMYWFVMYQLCVDIF